MEDQLVQVLANTLSPTEDLRKRAEQDLQQAQSNPAFPLALANISGHPAVDVAIRQSALSNLRLFVEDNWSPDVGLSPIEDAIKAQIRPMLLELAINSDDRKVKTAASFAVGKIANVDFPDNWPELLPSLLGIIPTANDNQLHGALKVLNDLVEESLSDDQFFTMAPDIVKVVHDVALDGNRKPLLRALAIAVFKNTFNLMDIVKEEHAEHVTNFANQALQAWFDFILQVMNEPFPDAPADITSQPAEWNGLIALKLQAIKCLLKVREVFPSLLAPRTPGFFEAAWQELLKLREVYEHLYLENEAQSRLEDSDGLPYTLDFLVLEELDFLKSCLTAPPVRKQLDSQLSAYPDVQSVPWVLDLMSIATAYSRITLEEEGMWDIDVSVYLAEETSVSANYTPRIACGDLLIKLGEWLRQSTLVGLFTHTRMLFSGEVPSWRRQEAALFLLTMIVTDFLDCDKQVDPQTATAFKDLVTLAIGNQEQPLLRARGYLVAGMLVQCSDSVFELFDRTIEAISAEESELVQVACIKAAEGFIKADGLGAVPGKIAEAQAKVVHAIGKWVNGKDMTDIDEPGDLLVTIAETLRTAIHADQATVLTTDLPALNLLFVIAQHAADNWQVTTTISEAFEDLVQTMDDQASYQALCAKAIPLLSNCFDAGNVTSDDTLITFAMELTASMMQFGSTPLPEGLVKTMLPKLNKLLMESHEGAVLRPGAESLRYMLAHDPQQMFDYKDEAGQSGAVICLQVVDRLLGTSIEDNAASEVGGLAAELVEKAGREGLGEYLEKLLGAVATRLATAEAVPLIQSLILVFARLSLNPDGARAVVDICCNLWAEEARGGDEPPKGLQVVLGKWLENSVSFAGYDEIRQNDIALATIYRLNDPRVALVRVKGDLIVQHTDKIMTRSRARQNPDQYTIIAAPLKIIKVLIEELSSASGTQGAAYAAAAAAAFADEEEDDGWEDDPDTIDLNLGSTKNDLMGYLEATNPRAPDDETQAILTEFFFDAATNDVAGFRSTWLEQLTEGEKEKLKTMENSRV